MVLSGMSSLEMVEENCAFMADPQPLNETELNAIGKVTEIINALDLIRCTSCKYCVEGCPMQINIPTVFNCHNNKLRFSKNNAQEKYDAMEAKASACVSCGQCEEVCPQQLPIRQLLLKIASEFET